MTRSLCWLGRNVVAILLPNDSTPLALLIWLGEYIFYDSQQNQADKRANRLPKFYSVDY
jgi:5'(3')-deoxyribonucleotidase